jgi:hypothetical protein
MTMQDFIVVGAGTLVLFVLFMGIGYAREYGMGDLWGVLRRYIAVRIMESSAGVADDPQSNADDDYREATTMPQNSNNGIAITATERNALLLHAKAEALATLVKAGKVNETEGIKLVFGVSPSSTNPRYQAARAALKAELAQTVNPYPQRTDAQQRAREALGLK